MEYPNIIKYGGHDHVPIDPEMGFIVKDIEVTYCGKKLKTCCLIYISEEEFIQEIASKVF